jgi:hypothetical protein
MSNDIDKLKIQFVISQVVVVFLAIFLTFLSLGFHNLRKEVFTTQSRLEKTIQLISSQLKDNQLPMAAENIDHFVVFIIDEKEGKMLVQRSSKDPDDEALWKSYESKLIYQMQKQTQGTIYFPEKPSWHFWKNVHMIRFEKLPDLGWIVAVEALLKPGLVLFREPYGPLSFLFFIFILIGTSIALWSVTYKNFSVIRKAISDHLETSLLSLTGENIWSKFRTQPEEDKPNLTSGQTNDKKDKDYLLPDLIKDNSASVDKPLTHEPHEESFLNKKTISTFTPTQSPIPQVKKDPPAREPSPLDDLTINISNVKSDLLKKMLKDLRGK